MKTLFIFQCLLFAALLSNAQSPYQGNPTQNSTNPGTSIPGGPAYVNPNMPGTSGYTGMTGATGYTGATGLPGTAQPAPTGFYDHGGTGPTGFIDRNKGTDSDQKKK